MFGLLILGVCGLSLPVLLVLFCFDFVCFSVWLFGCVLWLILWFVIVLVDWW